LILVSVACADDSLPARANTERGSLGEEVYGVMCDRVGAQALREDITGESFYALCHRIDGTYGDTVNVDRLPKLDPQAKNEKGEPVSLGDQEQNRARAIGRIEAFAKQRSYLIAALDAAMPDITVATKDIKNRDPYATCDPSAEGEGPFYDELAAMLGRFTELYNDQTVPHNTRAIARVLDAFGKPENRAARDAWARLESRKGYRPKEIALGLARPAASYPQLRDLANSLLGVIAEDSQPYEPNPQKDGNGDRVPVPGKAYERFSKLLEVAHLELRNAKADPPTPALVLAPDAVIDRTALSRPRDNLEILQTLMLAQDPAFAAAGQPRYIVRRDPRGYATVALASGAVPAPFVDADGDKLADVDELGRFKTRDGSVAPTPFFTQDLIQPFQRDAFGRATAGGAALYYDYVDTNQVYAAAMLADMKQLVNPNPAPGQGTMMDMMAGLPAIMGGRDNGFRTARKYADGGEVLFDQVKDDSPLLEMVYAAGQLLGDKSIDSVLLLTKQLFSTKQADLARVIGAVMAARNVALAHPEAKMPVQATLWDELLEVLAEIAKDRNVSPRTGKTLLEDLLDGLTDDATANLGQSMGPFAQFRDQITYDRNNINGSTYNATTRNNSEPRTPVDRSKPDSGDNRSIMQRFLQLVADSDGVAACNKEGALVRAKLGPIDVTLPTGFEQPYRECAVYKIADLGKFFVQSIVGEAKFNIRAKLMREGVFSLGLGAATVSLLEQSSGITGFWTPGNALCEDGQCRPRPQWAARLVFFDVENDSPNSGDINYRTNRFVRDLEGLYKGTNICPERVIPDPCRGNSDCGPDADVDADGMVHGLRNCSKDDWLQIRLKDSIFPLEKFGFYQSIAPTVRAFVNHKREDLFARISTVLSKHWQTAAGTPEECKMRGGQSCAKSGVSSYEALIAEMMPQDLFPALVSLMKTVKTMTVPRCTALNAQGVCTTVTQVPAMTVLVEASRAAMDPEYSKSVALKERSGSVTARKNDGGTHPQTTPVLMLANALGSIDARHEKYAAENPNDKDRKATFVRGRSALADVFMKTTGTGAQTQFANKGFPKITPVIIDMLRAQLWARCPRSFAPPYERCTWMRDTMPKNVAETIQGPAFASALDLADGIRADANAKRETERFLRYMMDEASKNDAFASTLASAVDMIQVLRDDTNLVPFFKVLAEATTATKRDDKGRVTEKSVIDSSLSLLGKISGKAYDADGNQICSRELDPNQILPVVIERVVTPMSAEYLNGRKAALGDKVTALAGKTPLEIVIDVVAEVNRAAPNEPKPKLDSADYESIAFHVVDFLTNKERGLEQLYEIVRKGTKE
jgi:hypothetical protein